MDTKNESTEVLPARINDSRASQMERFAAPDPAGAPPSYGLVRMAIERNLPIEQLRELLTLHREEEDRQARRAYTAAMAACKLELAPGLARDKKGDVGKYSTLGLAVETVTPVAAKHGLTFDHMPDAQDEKTGRITVSCRVTHAMGHTEVFTLSAMPDKGPRRNDIQATGSAFTYLRRMTLFGAFGLSSVEDDDDGRAAGKAPPEGTKEGSGAKQELPERARKPIDAFKRWGIAQADLEGKGGVNCIAASWEDEHYQALNDRYNKAMKLAEKDRRAAARQAFGLPDEKPPEREAGQEG